MYFASAVSLQSPAFVPNSTAILAFCPPFSALYKYNVCINLNICLNKKAFS
nr:MAG TPA: hypothetical protein [Caudoviricetes sp.]